MLAIPGLGVDIRARLDDSRVQTEIVPRKKKLQVFKRLGLDPCLRTKALLAKLPQVTANLTIEPDRDGLVAQNEQLLGSARNTRQSKLSFATKPPTKPPTKQPQEQPRKQPLEQSLELSQKQSQKRLRFDTSDISRPNLTKRSLSNLSYDVVQASPEMMAALYTFMRFKSSTYKLGTDLSSIAGFAVSEENLTELIHEHTRSTRAP